MLLHMLLCANSVFWPPWRLVWSVPCDFPMTFFPGCLPPRYNLQLIMFLLSSTQFVLACMGPWNHQHSSESTHHSRISLSLLLTLASLSGLGNRQSIFSLYSFAALEYIMCELSFFCLAHCIWFIYVVPKVVRSFFFNCWVVFHYVHLLWWWWWWVCVCLIDSGYI